VVPIVTDGRALESESVRVAATADGFWPDDSAFLVLPAAVALSGGLARCTGIALCNAAGQPAILFEQGDTAYFYGEFELLQAAGAVACGLEFRDVTHRTIHGKNSFQTDQTPQRVDAGTRVRLRYHVALDVGPGEYWFSVGVAAASADDYLAYREGRLGHRQFATQEWCRMTDVGSFAIRLRDSGELAYHGMVNLPARCDVTVWTAPADAGSREEVGGKTPPSRQTTSAPTIFHVTHWKAGSQWINQILRDCVPDQIVPPQAGDVQFVHWPIQMGKVYPTIYVTKQEFDRVHVPDGSRRFVVIRDLRDTLVSAYFSFGISHSATEPAVAGLRATLNGLDREEGLLHLLRDWLPRCANIQASWFEAGERLIRYEDLLASDLEILEPLLLDECGLAISRERFREAVMKNRFENVTGRRRRGEEDVTAHQRKGVAGDWRNHFTDRIKTAFKLRFGALLVATGYERDLEW
jgi:hypothetical protein